MKFEFSDSLLLTSICNTEGYGKGAQLKDIIAYADVVNHCMITWNEVSNGLVKLKNAKLVDVIDKKVYVKDSFNEWWLKRFENKKRIYLLKQVNDVNIYLNKTYLAIENHKNENQIGLTEKDYQKAIDEYTAMLRK